MIVGLKVTANLINDPDLALITPALPGLLLPQHSYSPYTESELEPGDKTVNQHSVIVTSLKKHNYLAPSATTRDSTPADKLCWKHNKVITQHRLARVERGLKVGRETPVLCV